MKSTIESQKNPLIDRFEFDEDDEANKFSDFYIPLEILGSGSFGTCVSARDITTKQIYAVKVLRPSRIIC
jgi:serine/threonine protein kinase